MTRSQWDGVLDWLVQHLASHHPNLHHSISREAWDGKVEDLQSRLPSLNDHRAQTELMSLVASIGDAHTILHWEPSEVYPLRFYWFSDGLYVIKAQDKYGHLLNSRVLAINALSMDQLVDAVKKVIPHENKQRLRQELPNYLIHPGILHGLGITPTEHAMQLTCMAGDGTVKTAAVTAVPNFRRDWLHYSGLLPQGEDGHTPLYLKNRQLDYWFEYVSEHQTVYFQYNCCCDNASYPLADLIDRLLQCINSQGAARLVVDLRHNSGGDSRLLGPLIHCISSLKKINRPGGLYVVVGRGTFSAALMNALQLREQTKAILVGEPTGGKPNAFGEVRFLALPGTDLTVSYSTKYFKLSSLDTESFVPDHIVELSFADYKNGRDPAWEFILRDEKPTLWRFLHRKQDGR